MNRISTGGGAPTASITPLDYTSSLHLTTKRHSISSIINGKDKTPQNQSATGTNTTMFQKRKTSMQQQTATVVAGHRRSMSRSVLAPGVSTSNMPTEKKTRAGYQKDLVNKSTPSTVKNSYCYRKPSIVVDLTQEESQIMLLSKTQDQDNHRTISTSSQNSMQTKFKQPVLKSSKTPLFSQNLRKDDQSMMNSADIINEEDSSLGIIVRKQQIVGDNIKTVKGPSKKIAMQADNARYLRSQSSAETMHNRVVKGDETTSLRKNKRKFEKTQQVHFQVGQPRPLIMPTGSNFEPSPIRKFNEDELVTFDNKENGSSQIPPSSFDKESNLISQTQFQMLTPDEQDRVLRHILNNNENRHSITTQHNPRNKAHINLVQLSAGGNTIRRLREHDDQMMLKSTTSFKTPRSKDQDYADEDIPPSSSIKKSSRRQFNDNRFQQVRQINFNLISTLQGNHSNFSSSSLPTQRQYNFSPDRGTNSYQSILSDSASSKVRCCQTNSPFRSFYMCCAAPQQSGNPQIPKQLQSTVKKPPNHPSVISRNNFNNQRVSTFNQSDDIIQEEDEENADIDETNCSSEKHSLQKRMNIKSLVISPGQQMLNQHSLRVVELVAQQENTSVESLQGENDSQHYSQVLAALRVIQRKFRIIEENEIEHLKVRIPQRDERKKVIIFDMDETLIHCVNDPYVDQPDIILTINFPEEPEPVEAGFNIRPYLLECLEEATQLFQVGVFTASHQSYADAVLDFIDPEHTLFSFRLYRDSCLKTNDGYYVKDLRIFEDLPLHEVVLIDNSVYSFAHQIENGVPIIPFYHDKNDEELLHLIKYMEGVAASKDVREYNREAFGLRRLAEEVANESSSEESESGNREEEEDDEYQINRGSNSNSE